MTKEQFKEYLTDNSKEVTPVMFFYYKLKGGQLSEYDFTIAFRMWSAKFGRQLGLIHARVFSELTRHFKL